MIQFHKYSAPDGDVARMAAIAARQFFWGQLSWTEFQSRLPQTLPTHIFYAQEIVACLGMERACAFYNLSDEQYFFYLGLNNDNEPPSSLISTGTIVYKPPESGFFSVVDNMIVAAYVAHLLNKTLLIDNTYQWWDYEEAFGDIFRNTFGFSLIDKVPDNAEILHFESMRDFIFKGSEVYLRQFYQFKETKYKEIEKDIRRYYKGDLFNVLRSGLMFVRGGDKVHSEVPLQPWEHYLHDLEALARRCSRMVVLSDQWELARDVISKTSAINITPMQHRGYYHKFREKVSCLPILKNYLAIVDCLESVSCPSTNLVNAAHWTRSNDTFNYNTYNPVYRYALI